MNLEVLWVNNNNLESIYGLNSNVRMQVLHAEVSWSVSVDAVHPWPLVVIWVAAWRYKLTDCMSCLLMQSCLILSTSDDDNHDKHIFCAVCVSVLLKVFSFILARHIHACMYECFLLWFLHGSQDDT